MQVAVVCFAKYDMQSFVLFTFSGALNISIRPADKISVLIKPGPSTQAEKFCKMCAGRDCFPERKIQPGEQFNFSFGCSMPEKYWVLVVERYIGKLCPSLSKFF